MVNHIILNDVIVDSRNSIQYKVIKLYQDINRCHFIELNTTKLKITPHSISDILEKIDKREMFIDDPDDAVVIKSFDRMTPAEIQIIEARWAIIEFMTSGDKEELLLSSQHRSKVILDAVKNFEVGKSAVYNYIRMFYQGGMTKFSLMSNYYKCGGAGKAKNYTKKPGRKNLMVKLKEKNGQIEAFEGVIIDSAHKSNILIALKRHHLANKGISLRKTYDLMILELYTKTDKVGNKVAHPYHQIPTLYQFYYHTKKLREESYEAFARKKDGDREFNLTKRAHFSNTVKDAFGPGFRYEIDSTKPNIHLVDSSRKYSIGTPVIHLVVDSFSKMFVGISVGLENAGWNGASSALYNCIEDKREFSRQYDVELSNTDWVNSSLPSNLLADRGELVGKLPEDLIRSLGVNIENTPSYRGDLKGNIEKLFHIVEQELFGLVPGFSKTNFKARGERDENKHARFTIKDVTKAYILAIVKWNNSIMTKYPMTQPMLGDKLVATPTNVWNWGIQNLGSAQRSISDKNVILALLRDGVGSVTETGIKFNGMSYCAKELIDKGWFVKARGEKRWKVDIKYDERNMDTIYMKNYQTNQFVLLEQTQASIMSFKNLTMAEVFSYDELRKRLGFENKNKQNEVNVVFYDEIKSLTKHANQRYKESNGNEVPTTKNKRGNRKNEVDKNNPNRALTDKLKPTLYEGDQATQTIVMKPTGTEAKENYADAKRKRLLNAIDEVNES